VSRVMTDVITPEHRELANSIKKSMAAYADAEDLINIGAYKQGANPEIDKAIELHPAIQGFLRQDMSESFSFDETLEQMMAIVGN